jgi:hypothetical protein
MSLVLHSVNMVTDSLAVTPAKARVRYLLEDLDFCFYLKVSMRLPAFLTVRGNDEKGAGFH